MLLQMISTVERHGQRESLCLLACRGALWALPLLAAAWFLNGCGSRLTGFGEITRIPFVAPVPNVSPYIAGPATIQGVAVDPYGDYYISFTNWMAAYDSHWKLVWKNSHPFSGIPLTVNHIGDIEYYNGFIYAPIEEFKSCQGYSPVLIAVYNADTGALVNWIDISADGHEASATTVVPEQGTIVVSSFCLAKGAPSTFWRYDLQSVQTSPRGSALRSESTMALSQPINYIQGISWDRTTGQFLLSAAVQSSAGTLWWVSGTGKVEGPVFNVPTNQGNELEGVDATAGNAYYAEKGYIYGIPMPAPLAPGGQPQ